MPFAAALSTAAATSGALAEVCERAGGQLAATPDLAFVFFSPHHAPAAATIARVLTERLKPKHLMGCVAEAVIGNEREIEGSPALSLWLARWGRAVTATPFHLTLERTADGPSLLG